MSRDIEITSLSAIEHVAMHRPARIKRLLLPSDHPSSRLREIESLARTAQIKIEYTAKGHELCVRAVLYPFRFEELRNFLETRGKKNRWLILDRLQDPQNFGALCRTAEALGLDAVIIPKDRSSTISSGVYAASAGAIETIPIILVSNLADAVRKLKDTGVWVLASTLTDNATLMGNLPELNEWALILGAEHVGVSAQLSKLSDWHVRIPLAGHVQSLNVNAAGAILMYYLIAKHEKECRPANPR